MFLHFAIPARAAFFFALSGLLLQCSAPPAPPAPNQAPVAEAGADQQAALAQEVSIDGELSADPEGSSLSFAWRAAIENPVPIVFPETQPRFSFTPSVAGTYIFILTVSDGPLSSDPDSIRISVSSSGNQAPIAKAGPDIVVGANSTVPLSALASSDPDGDALTYQRAVLSSPAEVQLADPTAPQTSFTPIASGEYRLRLTVSDGELSATVEMSVLVRSSGNQAPVANAGPDQQVAVSTTVTLDGSLSIDPDAKDGAMLLYHWIVGTAPSGAVELSDSTAVQPTFIATETGNYIFGLEVSDGDLTSLLIDVVTVQVVERIFAEQNGMIEIPAGSFNMGSNIGSPDESPLHRVELDLYWIDKFEVTTGLYKACVDAGVCPEAAMTAGCNSGRDDRREHPINCVSWEQATTYCLWQAKRLPTEAEWERAARGEDGRTYAWGEDFPSAQLLNFNNNVGTTVPVGTYPLGVSFYGLHNMGGNVQEWTADYFATDYYAQSPEQNPQGPDSGTLRTGRGASWKLGVPLEVLTTTVRAAFVPNMLENSVGFRCASDMAPSP
ncbi:MAG TPA: hypothetical protein EYG11_18005 [Candidatus Latescibacteria bacterium]|nr:hypothetical protein [Candidatus Latescibacterota bacterium]